MMLQDKKVLTQEIMDIVETLWAPERDAAGLQLTDKEYGFLRRGFEISLETMSLTEIQGVYTRALNMLKGN